jgi:ribosomal protein L11 methyltransferase
VARVRDYVVVRRLKPAVFTSITVATNAQSADEAAGIFSAFGALGCEIRNQPAARLRGASRTSRVCAYFKDADQSALDTALELIGRAGMLADGAAPHVSRITDPGWATMWQKRFEPFPVGERLLVVPPWNRSVVDGRVSLVIRPGQAFGTGHHASTYGVLNLLERLLVRRKGLRALDVGTGSGILAIAMRKLGAAHITAIDLDSVALENAQENADLNRVAGAIRFSVAPLSSIRGRFDVITANILSSVLIEMAPRLKARLRPRGYLILAGILAREAERVVSAYCPELRRVDTRADGAWRALLFQL